jgi:hypothetical protein
MLPHFDFSNVGGSLNPQHISLEVYYESIKREAKIRGIAS